MGKRGKGRRREAASMVLCDRGREGGKEGGGEGGRAGRGEIRQSMGAEKHAIEAAKITTIKV
jgi:hypothetical protein